MLDRCKHGVWTAPGGRCNLCRLEDRDRGHFDWRHSAKQHEQAEDAFHERADWKSSGLDEIEPEHTPVNDNTLPEDDAARLDYPMFDGLIGYFPNALAEVSRVSKLGNDQHNPGQPLHWARGKSTDHENKIVRHLLDAGRKDARGVRHSARLAWRALALLQEELEREEGAPMARNAKRYT